VTSRQSLITAPPLLLDVADTSINEKVGVFMSNTIMGKNMDGGCYLTEPLCRTEFRVRPVEYLSFCQQLLELLIRENKTKTEKF
jgi:hypothetical protein